jgi:hypothetical protein
VASAGLLALAVAVGAVALVAGAIAFRRAPQAMAVAIVLGFALQPTLVFYLSVAFGPAKDAIVLAGLLSLLAAAAFGLPAERRGYDAWLVGAIVLLLGMYLLNPAGGHGAGWSNGARLTIEAFGLFLLGYLGPRPRRTWQWALWALVGVALLNVAVGLAQQGIGVQRLVHQFGYQFGDEVRTTAGGRFRSFGTLNDPFNYAALLALALVCATFELRGRLAVCVASLLAAGIAISYVRTELVLMAVIAALALLRVRRAPSAVGPLLAVLIAAVGLLALTPQPTLSPRSNASVLSTLNGRTSGWSELLASPSELLAGRGVGAVGSGLARSATTGIYRPGRFTPGSSPAVAQEGDLRNVDSTYLATLADVGLLGLVLIVAILGRMLVLIRPGRRGDGRALWTCLGLWLVVALDALTRSSLSAFPYGFIALYLLGCSLARREAELDGTPSVGAVASEHAKRPDRDQHVELQRPARHIGQVQA